MSNNILSKEEVEAAIGPGEIVHVFVNPRGGILVGADWTKAELIALVAAGGKAEVGGKACLGIGHGLVIWNGDRPLFCETTDEWTAKWTARKGGAE